MSGRIQITGLRELRRELKAVDDRFPKEIARLNKRLVNQLFVPDAKRRAAGRANPRPGHQVIDTIRGLGSQTRAQMALGRARVPWAVGHEFGSNQVRRTARGGHTTQFPPRSPSKGRGNAGYFFYPSIYDNLPRAMDAYADMLTLLLRSESV